MRHIIIIFATVLLIPARSASAGQEPAQGSRHLTLRVHDGTVRGVTGPCLAARR